MSERKNWPLALSVGPGAMNADTLSAMCAAGIRQAELSSGAVDPFYSVLDFPHKAKEITAFSPLR